MPGIKAKITVDTKDVKKGLDNVKKDSSRALDTVGKTLDKASKGMHGVEDAAKNLLSTIGGWGSAAAGGLAVFVAAVGFAFNQFSKFKEQAKAIQDGAKRTNMGTGEYAKLSYEAQQTGTSVEALVGIINKLNDAVDKSKKGNWEYIDTWNALRIDILAFEKMTPPSRKIEELSRAIRNYKRRDS